MASNTTAPPPPASRRGFLDWVEWIGNKLPEPALLFAILAAIVVIMSAVGAALEWRVQPVQIRVQMTEKLDGSGRPELDAEGKPVMTPRLRPDGRPETRLEDHGTPLQPHSLLTSEGIYWMLSSMLKNFTNLPALPLVFVAMLGIGAAEKFGLFNAFLRWLALATPRKLITPMVVFLGANASVASDAGYIILPPLAAALYLAMGRHPVAGLAASFAGVAGGFGGGFFPTASDGFLAGVATQAAHIIDPDFHAVLATHNWYFKMGSAIVVMFAGWFVTDRIVEPRLNRIAAQEGAAADTAGGKSLAELALTPVERRGLLVAGVAHLAVLGVFFAMVLLPGWPLEGRGLPTVDGTNVYVRQPAVIVPPAEVAGRTVLSDSPVTVVANPGRPRLVENAGDRWSQVIVPLIFFAFLIPGTVYGFATGTIKSQKDFIEGLYHGIRTIIPVLAIAFFMGQFVNYFTYSGLDRMLAFAGGKLLVQADLPIPVMIVLFVTLVIGGDFAISGMLSKYGILAPIFIPMFMMIGMSPELTTAAYRIGDSVVNVITPLNSYLLIILVVLQKYRKDAGLGTLISLMLPYSLTFYAAWTAFLLLWYFVGFDLGTQAPLHYDPAA